MFLGMAGNIYKVFENVFLKEVLCKCKNCLSIAPRNCLLLLERVVIFLFSFRQCYPTISE